MTCLGAGTVRKNSYGKYFGVDGVGEWVEGNGSGLYNITFLVDQPNNYPKTKMKKVIMLNKEQYVVNNKTVHRIPDLSTRNFLLQFGWIVKEIDQVQDLNGYKLGIEIPSLIIMKEMKKLKPILDDAFNQTYVVGKNFPTGLIVGKMYSTITNFFRKK